jgi:alpha-methylacyl-CoA racemase
MTGPLHGIRIVELGGIGPGPFCGMVMGDLGADVIRIDRPADAGRGSMHPVLHRNRRSIAVDLKDPAGAAAVLSLVDSCDALIEGFRPGVAERLGLGPAECLARNPRLVYGRITGWGQDGPMGQDPGHDINYIGLSGALHGIGPAGGDPVVPLNLIGDFGGGGMLLAVGVLGALLSARTTGQGQVVDSAMVDGSALLMAMAYGFLGQGLWTDERGVNLLDGGAPFYGVYRCADGRHVALGSLEPQFYAALVRVLQLDGDPVFAAQHDRSQWPAMKQRLTEIFATRTRDEWAEAFQGQEACVSPVLSMTEAPAHPHNVARRAYLDGVPAPAPRFLGTPTAEPTVAGPVGADTRAVLEEAGVKDLDDLFARGVIG